MRLNLALWAVAKTFYTLSMIVMLPLIFFIWFSIVPDAAKEHLSSTDIMFFAAITIGYGLLGWILLIYTPKKYRSDLFLEIDRYKKQGFNPTIEVIGHKNFNSYAGWNELTDQFVMINLNDNVSVMTSKKEGLLKWHLKERENVFEMITDIHTPSRHIVRGVIPIRPDQYHTLSSALIKHKKQLEERSNTRPPFLPTSP